MYTRVNPRDPCSLLSPILHLPLACITAIASSFLRSSLSFPPSFVPHLLSLGRFLPPCTSEKDEKEACPRARKARVCISRLVSTPPHYDLSLRYLFLFFSFFFFLYSLSPSLPAPAPRENSLSLEYAAFVYIRLIRGSSTREFRFVPWAQFSERRTRD